MRMKVSDYVIAFLADRGVDTVFLLSGGGVMHLLDSLGNGDSVGYPWNRHEQACAIAAEGYARMTGRPGVCLVTTGPAPPMPPRAFSALGRLAAGAGDLRTGATRPHCGLRHAQREGAPGRQHPGHGGADDEVRYGRHRPAGRPGRARACMARSDLRQAGTRVGRGPPRVQAELIEPDELEPFRKPARIDDQAAKEMTAGIERAARALHEAQRPLRPCGSGVRTAAAVPELRRLLDSNPLPAVVPDSGKDLIPEDHPLNLGVFGPAAQRRANFAVQNCDCLIVLAAALSAKKIGFNYADFARQAVKFAVDIYL